MKILYSCPSCSRTMRHDLGASPASVACACGWSRQVGEGAIREGQPQQCLVCGCEDLWRQKDFPQKLGVLMVALGALLSTIAIAFYYPATALGILLAFAFADLLLYVLMPDVLVCYRCQARHGQSRHGQARPGDEVPRFNLETAERYRQEAARLAQNRTPGGASPEAGR